MAAGTDSLARFRERVQELCRHTKSDGRRATQGALAAAIGLSAKELSLQLHGRATHRLTPAAGHAIIRTLAEWGAITTTAEAEELAALASIPISAAEWQSPPFSLLTKVDPVTDTSETARHTTRVQLPANPTSSTQQSISAHLRELYRATDPYGTGRPPTQADLAEAIGLDDAELSRRLNGASGKRLSERDARAIVRTLAAWEAIATRAEAEELLQMMGASSFTAAAWQSPPLDLLTFTVAPPSPNNLPRQLTSFVGREAEIATCLTLIATHPLLTITGAGGMGKTRLSLELATRLLPEFKDGVYFVPLATLTDPALVPGQVARALGLDEQPRRQSLDLLREYLQGKKFLLLLDNCEHLRAACAQLVASLLPACPGLSVIATSRADLAVPGEAIYLLEPLTMPTSVENAAASTAIQLFITRATMAQPDFVLDSSNASSIVNLCRLLEGIPLAIELAAPLIRVMSAAQMVRRLDARFGLLLLSNRTLPARQQTMRACVEWSYDLLDPAERTLFARLAVFHGGWSIEAAEQVCADDPDFSPQRAAFGANEPVTSALDLQSTIPRLQSAMVLPTLITLVQKSLVQVRQVDGEVRYQMLETIREYARDKLSGPMVAARLDMQPAIRDYAHERFVQSDEQHMVREHHLRYFLALAEAASPHMRAAEEKHWLTVLESEHDNLRAAFAYALSLPDRDDVLRLSVALNRFWTTHGHSREACRLLDTVMQQRPAQDSLLWAQLLYAAAAHARLQGDYSHARQFSNQALALARRCADDLLIARILNNQGLIDLNQGDYPQAKILLEEAMSRLERIGNHEESAVVMHNLGYIADEQGDYPAASHWFSQSLAIARQLGSKSNIATNLIGLSDVAMQQGDYSAAEGHLRESIAIAIELGDRRGAANSTAMLGVAARMQGDYPTAEALLRESLAVMRELGNRGSEVQVLAELGQAAQGRGDPQAALELHRQSLRLAHTIGYKQGTITALRSIAALLTPSAAERAAVITTALQANEHPPATLPSPRPPLSLDQAVALALEE